MSLWLDSASSVFIQKPCLSDDLPYPVLYHHAKHFESLFRESGVDYSYQELRIPAEESVKHFILPAQIDGIRVCYVAAINRGLDFYSKIVPLFDVCFAPYAQKSVYAELDNVYPFSPPWVGFDKFTWFDFRKVLNCVRYDPKSSDVMIHARRGWHGDLRAKQLALKWIDQTKFSVSKTLWKRNTVDFLSQINGCLFALAVPGVSPFYLDRAACQYMALGCCTVHPKNDYPFPDGGLVPGVHYLQCKPDLSDVDQVVEAYSPEEMLRIGQNAQSYIQQHFFPVPMVNYIRRVVHNFRQGKETIYLDKVGLLRTEEEMRKQRHVDRYRLARKYAHGVVVDFGSGSGYGSFLLSEQPLVERVVGLEVNSDVAEFSRRSYPDVSWDAVSHCDTLVAIEVLEHLEDLKVFGNLSARLSPETIIVSCPIGKTTSFNKFHRRDIKPQKVSVVLGKSYQLEQEFTIGYQDSFLLVYQRAS